MITRGIARGIVCPTAFLSVFLSVVATGAVSFTVGDISASTPYESGTAQVSVVSSDTSAWSGHIVVEWGTLSNPDATFNAGLRSTIVAYSDDLGEGFAMNVPRRTSPGYPNGNNQMAGTQFTMDLTLHYRTIVSLWDDSRDFRLGPVQYEEVQTIDLLPGLIGADCGGPYWIAPGESIALLGYRSLAESLQWSIDGHTVGYEVITPISYDYLVNTLGLGEGVHSVELMASGLAWDEGYTHRFDYTTLTIVPEPVSAMFLGLGFLMVARRLESTEKNISRRAR